MDGDIVLSVLESVQNVNQWQLTLWSDSFDRLHVTYVIGPAERLLSSPKLAKVPWSAAEYRQA